MMNHKKRYLLTLLLICLSLSSLLSTLCCAQEAKISITSANAVLLQNRTVGNREVHYYKIIVILHNSGGTKSDEISVKFYDPEYNATTTPPLVLSPANYSLMPGESKAFDFSEWPTPLSGDVPLNISFSPSSPSVPTTQYNSGYYLYTLHIGSTNKKTSTPGFELAVLLIAIALLLAFRKRDK
jgi:hypothetical protein